MEGVVQGTSPADHEVTIAHDPIVGYMDAMTMTIAVDPSFDLRTITIGDRVRATLVVDSERSHLEGLTRVSSGNAGVKLLVRDPEIGSEIADFVLVDQDGHPFRLHDLRGRVVAVTFIYTRCPLPDYCKLMTDRFAGLERELRAKPDEYSRTHLLSISIDPERDDPATLTSYAERSLQPDSPRFDHWSLATGSPDDVRKVAASFGLAYELDSGQIVHSLRTAVIGADGRLIQLFRGNKWTAEELQSAVERAGVGSH